MADRWFEVDSTNLYSFCGESDTHRLGDALDGTNYWEHNSNEEHWFIIDLLQVYEIKQVRGRSGTGKDPTLVDIYVSRTASSWGEPVATNIATWQDTASWQNVDVTDKIGRFVRVVIKSTEDAYNYLRFGGGIEAGYPYMSIFDVYLDDVAGATIATTSGEAGLTAQQQCEQAGKYWYNDTCNDNPQYERDIYISGFLTRFQKRQLVGYYPASGDLRSVTVNASGHLYSDIEVILSSGLWVDGVSGQHVFVESGVHVITDIEVEVSSGLHVNISGQHIHLESGDKSDAVIYGVEGPGSPYGSGQLQPVETWGRWLVIAGAVDDGACSGFYSPLPLTWTDCSEIETLKLKCTVSGDHIFVESGVHVVTDTAVGGSGQVIHIGCSDTVRTGGLKDITAASGGEEICQVLCSGPVHSVIVKSLSGNDDIFIGGEDCKPYSGFGFLLSAEEAINLDVCDVCDIWACANASGNRLTYIGTDY